MENNFSCGAMPSPEDKRDYKLEQLISKSTYVPSIYLPETANPVFDQGRTSQCVACSLALTRYIQEKAQTNVSDKFSPTYIYGNRTEEMYQGDGMYPREALRTLKNFGAPHWEELPGHYDFNQAKQKYENHKNKLDDLANPYRISSYYRVNTDEETKQAIYTLGAVSGMFPVFQCLYYPEDGFVKYDETIQYKNNGYHQMTIIGWTDKYWIVQNSWGTNWGNNGVCYLPFNYPIQERWAIVDDIIEEKLSKNECCVKSFFKKLFKK